MKESSNKIHIVNLFKWRSIVALIACIITIVLALACVAYGITTVANMDEVRSEFHMFTIDSNLLTAFAALMILPYTVDGIKRKRLVYPKWLFLIHYAGTICVTVTMIFTVFIMSWFDQILAFGGKNFFLHTICPLAVLISFFMVESNHQITKLDVFHGLIPFVLYSLVYFYFVMVAHVWEDYYGLNTVVPFYISIPGMYLLAYLIAQAIRYIHTLILKYRDKKLKSIWDDNLEPITIKIDIYSLGIHAGLHEDKEDISIPFDILEEVSNRFNIEIEELAQAYTKGIISGFKEKEYEASQKHNKVTQDNNN